MPALPVLPDAQIRPLLGAYARTVATRRRWTAGAVLVLLLAALLAASGAEVRLGVFWDNLGALGSYGGRLGHLDDGSLVWTNPAEWFWGWRRWSLQLGQTLLIAYAATITGALLGLAGGLAASRATGRSRPLRFLAARALELMRTVPDLVFALLFVVAFGLGPLPGVLAMSLHTAGTLGKMFAEVMENIDPGPVDGVAAAGGSWLAQVRFGVLPQAAPGLLSFTLLRFEVNVRAATVIGFVGAGGIGQELIVAIRKFYYSDVSAMLLMILLCVVLIDLLSEQLRRRVSDTA